MATHSAELYDTLAARMLDYWPAAAPPVKWPGRPFVEPAKSEYVAFWVLDGEGERVSVVRTLPLRRFAGTVDVNLFTPLEGGYLSVRAHADRVADIFDNREILTASNHVIRLRTTSLDRVGEEAGWQIHNAWTRFVFEAAF